MNTEEPKSLDQSQLVKELSGNAILVNLDIAPKKPFDELEVEKHIGGGWVKLEKRADGLYMNDRKIVLHYSVPDYGWKLTKGSEMLHMLRGYPVLNANVLDALIEHSHLIPDEWEEKIVFFWGSLFRGFSLWVRYLSRNNNGWCSYECRLDRGYVNFGPAALLGM